jgi:hypothetical protein
MQAVKLKNLRDPAEVKFERLEEHPKYQAAHAELEKLTRRFEEAQQRERVALARRRGQLSTVSPEARAQALVAGGAIKSSSPAAELEAAQEEMDILRQAMFTAHERLEAIAGELSYELCKRLAPLNAEALVNAHYAAQALHDALESNRVLRARIITAGYTLSDSAMPRHDFPTACMLGDPDRVGMTPAAMFKTWLADRGII